MKTKKSAPVTSTKSAKSTKKAKKRAYTRRAPKAARGAKAAFVRANLSLPVSEVLAQAKQAGLSMSAAYVYTLRGKMKKGGAKAKRSMQMVMNELNSFGKEKSLEHLYAVAADIGLSESIAFLQSKKPNWN